MSMHELTQQWAAAEESGDVATLDALTTDDFTMVGPTGIIMTKTAWLDRYRSGELVTHSLTWAEDEVRSYGPTAIVIGVHTQQTDIRGKPINRTCRTTLIVVHRDSGWQLAGMHLSPLRG